MPETTNFLILGLTVSLGTLGLYVFSLYWRFINVRRDRATLTALAEE